MNDFMTQMNTVVQEEITRLMHHAPNYTPDVCPFPLAAEPLIPSVISSDPATVEFERKYELTNKLIDGIITDVERDELDVLNEL